MDISIVIDDLRTQAAEKGIDLFSPASDEDIIDLETCLNTDLPDDIRTFYKFANGFEGEWMFRILPLKDIVHELSNYSSEYSNGLIPLAEYLIFSETWALVLDQPMNGNYKIVKLSDGRTVTTSLAKFINKFVKFGLHGKDGLDAWYEVNI